jgi:hypothetical protein
MSEQAEVGDHQLYLFTILCLLAPLSMRVFHFKNVWRVESQQKNLAQFEIEVEILI